MLTIVISCTSKPNQIGPSMPNANISKEDKRSSNAIRKRQSAQNNTQAKINGVDSKVHDNPASYMADSQDKVESATNGGDNIDSFTRRLLKRKGNRSNGESDIEWEKVVCVPA